MNLLKYLPYLLSLLLLFACDIPQKKENPQSNSKANKVLSDQIRAEYAIVIHGGAGTILKKNMTPEKEKAYINSLEKALTIGENMLKNGAESLNVIEAVIMQLENDSLFNAGKGAVFTNAETNELDASIMDGKTMNAGAVGGVSIIKNPINAARAVMEQSKHVMLVGRGAETFAKERGIELVSSKYFQTQRRLKSLRKIKKQTDKTGFTPSGIQKDVQPLQLTEENDYKFGTVGCVVLDKNGNLAAGTSTGGMTNKRWNRIGDSPIIGAGTYADNNTCAVSSTGHGEYFIRFAVAHDICARMEYLGESLEAAANFVVNTKLVKKGGDGGIIAVDKSGNIAMPFNTAGMYRAFATPTDRGIKIYKN